MKRSGSAAWSGDCKGAASTETHALDGYPVPTPTSAATVKSRVLRRGAALAHASSDQEM